jgi:hypothetical protein
MSAAPQDDSSSSVYPDMKVLGPGFIVDRKNVNRKKDKWTKDDPVLTADKKRIDGYIVWSAKRPKEKWLQLPDDMGDGLAEWELDVSVGNINIEECLPHRELWHQYLKECEEAYERGDTELGAVC